MSIEDRNFSFDLRIAQPPTPTTTPTSANFTESTIKTPGTEWDFFDPGVTGSTSSFNKNSHNVSHPLRAHPTVSPAGESYDSAIQDINVQLDSHHQHLLPSFHSGLPPVDEKYRLSSSLPPDPDKTYQNRVAPHLAYSPRRSSMQTPPPSAISHEKAQDHYGIPSSITTMADSQKLSTPTISRVRPLQTPGRIFDASPQLFTNLQFSPDFFQNGMSGPATAPVLPQSRLFWEADPGSEDQDSGLTDPFFLSHATSNQSASSPVLSKAPNSASLLQSHNPYGLPELGGSPHNVLSSPSNLDGSMFPASFTASPRVPTARAEDPSMFLSSPARRFGLTLQPPTSLPPTQFSRQPYHHQIEESRREEASFRARKIQGKSVIEDAERIRPHLPPAVARPGIKRSVTHTGISNPERHARRPIQAPLVDSTRQVNTQSRPSSTGGRISPLKRNSQQAGLDRPPSRPRGPLSLTIDENGRAKTVFTTVSEPQDTPMTLDDGSSESGTSIDSADFNFANSRNTSFAFSDAGRTMPKHDHLRPDPKSHSKNSSYSSGRGSSKSTNISSRTSSLQTSLNPRSISVNNSSKGTPSYNDRAHSLATIPSSHSDSIWEYEDEDAGNAQDALRALKKDRPRRLLGNFRQSGNRENSLASFPSSPPIQSNAFDAYFNNAAISPTTITDPDLATPSTDRESSSSGTTRCICNTSEHWGHMIQCESCSKWLHTQCIGLEPDRIPPVYICIYCVQTPMRHGRLREPSRVIAMAPASPLARKSGRYRK